MGRRVKQVSNVTPQEFSYRPYRAVLLISRGRKDSRGQRKQRLGRERFKKEVLVNAVRDLRQQRGVHHVEPVVFHSWTDDVGKTPAPWAVNGAMVFVQSERLEKLRKNIKLIYNAAAKLDQEMMVLEPLGDLDSM